MGADNVAVIAPACHKMDVDDSFVVIAAAAGGEVDTDSGPGHDLNPPYLYSFLGFDVSLNYFSWFGVDFVEAVGNVVEVVDHLYYHLHSYS